MKKVISRVLLVMLVVGAAYAKGKKEPTFLLHIEDMERMLAEGDVVVLDIRDDTSYLRGHIPGALLVPLQARK